MANDQPGQQIGEPDAGGGAGAGAGGNGAGGNANPVALAQQQLHQANAAMMAAQQVAQQAQVVQQAQQLAHHWQAEIAKLKADMEAARVAAVQAAQVAVAGAGGGGQGHQNPYHSNAAWDPSKHVAPTALYGPNPESATATNVADAGMALNTAVNEGQPQTIPPEVERAMIRLPLPEAKGRLAPYIRASVVAASKAGFCKGTMVVEIERFAPPTADVFQAHPISKGVSVLSFVPGARILASLEAHGIVSDLFALLRLLLGDFNQAASTPDVMKWFRGWIEHFIQEWRKMTQLVNIVASFKEMPAGAPDATTQSLKAAIRHSMTDAVGFATSQLVRATSFSMSNALKPKFSSWLTALSAYGATWAVDPILFGSFGYDGAAERWTQHIMSGLSRKITYQTLIEFLPAVTGAALAPTGLVEQTIPVEVPASSFWPSAQARRKVSPVVNIGPATFAAHIGGSPGSPSGPPAPTDTSAMALAGTCTPTSVFSRTVFIQMLVELQRDRGDLKPSPFTNADVSMLRRIGDEEAMFRGTCTTCQLSLGTTKGDLSVGSHTHSACIKPLRVQKLVLNELLGHSQLSKGAVTELERVAVSRARANWDRINHRSDDRGHDRDHRRSSPPRGGGGWRR